jgi:hypothetical protein
LCKAFEDIEVGYIVYIWTKLLINDFIDEKNNCIKLKSVNTKEISNNNEKII